LKVAILGVPLDLGSARRGVDMGPSAIRAARLQEKLESLEHEVVDMGNVAAPEVETRRPGDEHVRFVNEITGVCESLAKRVQTALADGAFPVVLGGDHSIAMGTLGGVAGVRKPVGLIWLDAHGDFNTPETSPSGNVHGMPLAAILGRGHDKLLNIGGVNPKATASRTVLVGVRSLDAEEKTALAGSGVHVFTIREIDELGMKTVMERAIKLASSRTRAVHLSLDMDVLEPSETPGTGTPVHGGITYREAHLAMELLFDSGKLSSMDVVETNPILDEQNRTARLAVELICSALGQRILL